MRKYIRSPGIGLWLLVTASVLALALSLFDYFSTGNGIQSTPGALLVVISSALMLVAAIFLHVAPLIASWLRGTLLTLLALDVVGTALAAYMLESYFLLAAMAVALIGWLGMLTPRRPAPPFAAQLAAFVTMCALGSLLMASGSAVAQSTPVQPAASPEPAATVIGAAHYTGWYTFNGNLEDQKYSTADQITPENVGKLVKAWEVHTGDVSDGSGKLPKSDWSATPLFINDTVYVSTPFYRIFALAPDTGTVKWTYDTHALLEATTQPDLKTRGVAYWQAAKPQENAACQKMVYIGTMDAKLHAVDADTGKACEGFADKGVLNFNQWNTTNNKWPLSILQPPTVYKDTLFVGWAGKDWADAQAPPGSVIPGDLPNCFDIYDSPPAR